MKTSIEDLRLRLASAGNEYELESVVYSISSFLDHLLDYLDNLD